MSERVAYSVREVADMLGKSPVQVQRWINRGEIPAKKVGGLWLVGLPLLLATGPITEERHQLVHKMSPSIDRAKKRSVFFPGIAAAMAAQWGVADLTLGLTA